ncbi:unnamed protein product [marine sediment metagenome]|uniref:Alcohol dehydrogenase-like N-terminal domain-containing protein n=1 Tax=marine sediment metagenome TaxID=412755 RepID=X1H5E3_9ZZZZ
MKKMKAAMFYAPGDVRVEEVELPRVGDKEILVRVKIALTCGTDVKSYRRGYSLFKPPCLFGHEWATKFLDKPVKIRCSGHAGHRTYEFVR